MGFVKAFHYPVAQEEIQRQTWRLSLHAQGFFSIPMILQDLANIPRGRYSIDGDVITILIAPKRP